MVFVDTSFFYAVIDEADLAHDTAVSLVARVDGSALITTNHVLGESWTLINRRLGHRAATAFLDHLECSPTVGVERVREQTEGDALTWLRDHDEREYSFVDATSFAFMRENRIHEALAFDGDFAAAGFVELHI